MSQEDVLPEESAASNESSGGSTPASDGDEAAPPTGNLTEQLNLLSQQVEENWDKFVRTQAELENFKRRSEKDLQDARKFGLEKFARDLLPVADSLELGLGVEISDNPEAEKLHEGMALTLKQLLATLEKFNVVPVDPVNERFNPELHQAMAMQPTDEAEPNTVIKVYQKGYLLNGRLLRPAMVVVSQAIN